MGGRAARRLLVLLLVLAVILVAADRIAAYVAERAAGNTLQTSQHLSDRPDVDIAGFPFLNQLAAGDYDRITITADHIPIGESAHPLDLSRLQVVLHRLTVSRDFARFHAQTADAAATLAYSDLGKRLGAQLTYAGDGRVRASKQVSVAGSTVSGSVTARPTLGGASLGFTNAAVSGAGDLAAGVVDVLNQVFAVRIPLSRIPFDVRVTGLRADARGIVLTLTGRDLSYSR